MKPLPEITTEAQRLAGERSGLCVEERLITQGIETAARLQVRRPSGGSLRAFRHCTEVEVSDRGLKQMER